MDNIKEPAKQNTKYTNVSIIRLFATIIILVFHFILNESPYIAKNFFPFYFGVEIFAFISAFLYSQKKITSYKQFYIGRFKKIVVPTIVLLILFFVILGIYSLISSVNMYQEFIIDISNSYNSIGHLWFIPAILICYLLIYVLNKIENNKLLNIIISVVLVVLDFLIFNTTGSMFTSFLAGWYFKKYFENIKESTRKFMGIRFLIYFIILSVGYYCVMQFMQVSLLKTILYFYIVSFMGTTFCISAMLLLINFNNIKFQKYVLNPSNKFSFYIYLSHHIFIVGRFSFMRITTSLFLNIIIILALTVISSFVIMWITDLINDKLLKKNN